MTEVPVRHHPKIFHLITRLDRGGSSEVVLFLAKAQKVSHYQTAIVSGPTQNPPFDLNVYSQETGVPIYGAAHLRRELRPLADLLAFFELYRMIRREKPLLVHTHTSKAGFLGRLAARLAGVAVVVHTPHGHIFYGYYGKWKTAFFVFLERMAAKLTSRIITLTELGKKDHLSLGIGSPDQLVPIYCGIDLEPFLKTSESVESLRQGWGIEPGGFSVGTVGRLVSIKGHRYFLEAFSRIQKEFPNAKAILIGDGPLRRELERCAAALEVDARFLGNCTNIPRLLQALDLVVHPSLNEGLGRVLMEAAASGKPVVATRVGGIPEVVDDGKTGVLVNPKDSSAIAEACLLLLKDQKKREAMGNAAREKAVALFDQKIMVQKIEALYESLLSEVFS